MSMPRTSRRSTLRALVAVWLSASMCVITACSSATSQTPPPGVQRPERTVKLVFIHHSCGENWLADAHGGLGKALAANHYFVSDTNYGWGPNGIGDRTDITDWPEWFTGPQSTKYLEALYRESEQHCEYTRTAPDPGGENPIIMFKSCFPNSNLEGQPTDKPARGEGLSVANAKAIYNELLKYFATRPDRLFVVVTAPPVQDSTYAGNARAFNTWLVQDWPADYRGNNVVVFDYYNVLTDPGNHHRVRTGKVEYVQRAGKDTLYYPTDGDDHPSPAGNRKATEEFVPLLNHYYNTWVATKPKTAPTKQPPAEAPKSAKADEEPAAKESASAKPAVAAATGDSIDDFKLQATQAAVDGWQQIDIPWSRFKPSAWQGENLKEFDPHYAMGVAVAFESPETGRYAGQLWIDDVTLFAEKVGK